MASGTTRPCCVKSAWSRNFVKNADIIGGQAVLATELSVGTLADCSKPMSVRRIISIAAQVLDGLAYAHRKRMVHCDVTPGNIFLFPNGRAALGDFGIGLKLKGRMRTVDDFGTPGYVAPEQAYGRPTYRSDCFALGLILYEYITGVLPKWPFRWPPKGYKRLRERTNLAFVGFLKQTLAVDPDKRFANAEKMRAALLQAVPRKLKLASFLKSTGRKKLDWQKMRRAAFIKRYGAVVPVVFKCTDCGEPIAEKYPVQPRLHALSPGRSARVAVLSVVFRAGIRFPRRQAHYRHSIPRPLQTLRWKADALHAVLPLVPPEGTTSLAGSAVPGNMQSVRLVGGFDLLELLPLV